MKKGRVYHSTRQIDKNYMKYFDGKDVCRYYLGWSGEYLKYGDNLAAPRKDFRLYSTPRILVRQIPAKRPYCVHACFTDEVALNDLNSMNIINIPEKPEYVLGVLNSRLVSWWFVHKFGKMQRETFPQFKVNELGDFPLPTNGIKHRDEIAKLAAQILTAKRRNPAADTTALEKDIDRLLYELYGLTPEECAIVETERQRLLGPNEFGVPDCSFLAVEAIVAPEPQPRVALRWSLNSSTRTSKGRGFLTHRI